MNLETMEIVIGAGKYLYIFCTYICLFLFVYFATHVTKKQNKSTKNIFYTEKVARKPKEKP